MTDLLAIVRAMTEPILRRVQLTIGRAVVRAVKDSTMAQELQVTALAGETLGRVERLGPYGLTFHPKPGAEAVLACVGGLREHAIAIAVEDRNFRPTGLAEGEVALWQPDNGVRIILRVDGSVEITGATAIAGDVEITGELTVSGGVSAGGDVEDSAGSLQAHRDLFNLHTHKETGAGGGITEPPIPMA